MRPISQKSALWISCVALLALVACASGGGSSSSGSSSTSTSSSSAAAPAKPPKGVAAPAGHKLAQVKVGMNASQVKEILGEPTNQTTYPTGKAWIPFYFGPVAMTDFKYKGQGRVVFNNNRWSGQIQNVARVDYDPGEDGN